MANDQQDDFVLVDQEIIDNDIENKDVTLNQSFGLDNMVSQHLGSL